MSRDFSTCHPDRDIQAASEEASLLIEVDLQGLSLRVMSEKSRHSGHKCFTLLSDRS